VDRYNLSKKINDSVDLCNKLLPNMLNKIPKKVFYVVTDINVEVEGLEAILSELEYLEEAADNFVIANKLLSAKVATTSRELKIKSHYIECWKLDEKIKKLR